MDPFGNTRDHNFSWMGLASDWVEVTPNDTTALLTGASGQLGVAPDGSPSAGSPNVGIAVYCETAGDLAIRTPWGSTRTIEVAALVPFQTAIRGILSTGTTVSGTIHVAVVY